MFADVDRDADRILHLHPASHLQKKQRISLVRGAERGGDLSLHARCGIYDVVWSRKARSSTLSLQIGLKLTDAETEIELYVGSLFRKNAVSFHL